MENDDLSQLEELLCADINDDVPSNPPQLSEVDIFHANNETESVTTEKCDNATTAKQPKDSAIHNGDTDSSDDEERRNYTERKYNDYGMEVKKMLDSEQSEKHNKRVEFETRLRQTNIDVKVAKIISTTTQVATQPDPKYSLCAPEYKGKPSNDVYTDPIFGIRITKPLISSSALLDRMQGREAVNMFCVKRHVENGDLSQDWVTAGVIVRKSASKKSQKGSQFMIWTLSDLKDDLKTVSLFLFGKAYNELWKTTEGTVVAVLNPNVLDRSENSIDQACLSLDNADRCMILGQSKDLGICKSKKKNGEPCLSFVNLNQCEHCVYHVKQEYQKFSKRQELQSSTMGKGLVSLKKKVLGNKTVIYGGKSYTASPPSGKNNNIVKKDQNRLMSLSDYYKSEGDKLMTNRAPNGSGPLINKNSILHSPTTQRTSDTERLSKLVGQGTSSEQNSSNSQTLAQKVANSPKLGLSKGFSLRGMGTIDLNVSYSQKMSERAKLNAINLVKQNGGLHKVDPNNTKGTEAGKKRALDKLTNSSYDENDSKKLKPNESYNRAKAAVSERFKKILEATSAHQNLVEQHEDDEQEKYFNKLEKKEAMEEKMLNTFKLACKAVRCVKCKYTAFSAAQRCKDERHTLKVLDSFKRFFKCGNCGNRTVSLEIIPLTSCSNCNSSKWEKAPMMREKKVTLAEGLSIRGEEETFIGGHVTSGKNIDLLVPDN